MRGDKFVKVPELNGLTCPRCGGKNLEQMADNYDLIICRSCFTLYSFDEHFYAGKPCFRLKNTKSYEVFVLKEGNHWSG